MFKLMLSVAIIFIIAGCAREEKEAGIESPAEKVEIVEPFLEPSVDNIAGGEGMTGEKAAVRELIINYNNIVVGAQIHIEEVGDLQELTTNNELIRMSASIEKDRSEGKIMSCTLKNLTFKEISLKGENGVVRTDENWLFEDREVATGKVMAPLKDAEYNVEYAVVKKEGRWLVDKIELKKAKEYSPPRWEPKRVKIKTKEEEQ